MVHCIVSIVLTLHRYRTKVLRKDKARNEIYFMLQVFTATWERDDLDNEWQDESQVFINFSTSNKGPQAWYQSNRLAH